MNLRSNVLRNAGIALTGVLLIGGTLFILWRLAQATPIQYEGVRLPLGPTTCPRLSPEAIRVQLGCGADFRISIIGTAMSAETFAAILSRVERESGRHRYAVGVLADRRLRFDQVWKILRVCRDAQWGKVCAVVACSPDQSILGALAFRTVPDDTVSPKHVAVLLAPPHIMVQGREVDFTGFQRVMLRLARVEPRCPLVVRPSATARWRNVVAVLVACERAGLEYVLLQGPPDGPPAGAE